MALELHKHFFDDLGDVLDDVKKTACWPTTVVAEASPQLDAHWHDCDVHTYLLEGSSAVLDAESGERLELEAGDKLVVRAGTLHAECETKQRVTYVVALPEPRPFGEFLRMLPPDDPSRPRSTHAR